MKMSRPQSSKKGKRGSAKTPKKQIAELTEQNNLLTEELNSIRNENDMLKIKIETTIGRMLEVLPRKQFGIKDDTKYSDIPLDTLSAMMGKLIVKKKLQELSVEARVEELETRVTQMSMDIAKMTKKTIAYENGLQDLLKTKDIDDVYDRVYQLQLIAGQEYHHFTAHESFGEPTGNAFKSVMAVNGMNDNQDDATKKSTENAIRLHLVPPVKKYPGDTHIRHMHRDLRLYIMKELSLHKASGQYMVSFSQIFSDFDLEYILGLPHYTCDPTGADWRMLAERVGIDPRTIEHWTSSRLECPMGRVFTKWGESQSATVRLLHRHLISPQMRNTLLGKRLADFYDVD